MPEWRDTPEQTCVLCEGTDLFRLPAIIALMPWPVCNLCASAGAALKKDGDLAQVVHCLHLVACEIEQFAVGYVEPEDRAGRRWLYRLQRQLSRGAVRAVCPCDSCTGKAEAVVFTDMFDLFDVEPCTHADTMPLAVLKSMAPGKKIKASDGSTWRAVDEVTRRLEANALATRRGEVGPLARAAAPTRPGEWADAALDLPQGDRLPKKDTYRPVDARKRAKRDEESKRYWAAFRKWGRGRINAETSEWITDDGRRFPLRGLAQ